MFAILSNASHVVDFLLSHPDLDLSITVPHDAEISSQMSALEFAALSGHIVFAHKILIVLHQLSFNHIDLKNIV